MQRDDSWKKQEQTPIDDLQETLTSDGAGNSLLEASFPSPGSEVGHYQLIEKIASGGMGVVFRAVDSSLDREVAIKFLPGDWSIQQPAVERFVREAKTVASLDHPNIVVVHAIEVLGATPFMVMELVRGQTLRKLLPARGLPLRQLVEYAIPVADALAAAHGKGITHCDLKPENVMVTRDGRVKLLDFGIAKKLLTPGMSIENTQHSGIAGTVAYMSPEQIAGDDTDARSDVFSFGTLLYEMATGGRPFSGDSLAELLRSIREDEPADLLHRDDLPQAFSTIVKRCLAKQVSARPRNMVPVLDELTELRGEIQQHSLRALLAAPVTDKLVDGPPQTRLHPRTVAVLPLQDLSPDGDQFYFCVGLTEEIAAELSRVSDLRVTLATRMNLESMTPVEIGRLLGVSALIEGSVQRSGDRMRIAVRLVDVPGGAQLWASRFDRDIVDAFAVQDEIAKAVAKNFDVQLRPSRGRALSRDPRAYAAYLRGRYFWGRRYEDGLKRALECFGEALAIDPKMAEAHAGSADCFVILGHYGYLDTLSAYTQARQFVQRALDIFPDLADAHATLGWIQAFYDWNWQDAEASFQRALQLDPNYATAHEWYGIHWLARGQLEMGLQAVEDAHRIDPLSLMIGTILGWVNYELERYDEGDRILETIMGTDYRFVFAKNVYGAVISQLGRQVEAIEVLEQAVSLSGREGLTLAFLGFAYGQAGRMEEANQIVSELEKTQSHRYVSPIHLALPHAGSGRKKQALDWLETAVKSRDSFFASTHFSLLFRDLHDEPRFKSLLGKMNLT